MTKETHPLAHARINTLIGATYASVASLPVHLITLQGDLPKILQYFRIGNIESCQCYTSTLFVYWYNLVLFRSYAVIVARRDATACTCEHQDIDWGYVRRRRVCTGLALSRPKVGEFVLRILHVNIRIVRQPECAELGCAAPYVQGYLAHKKQPPSEDPTVRLCLGTSGGPRGGGGWVHGAMRSPDAPAMPTLWKFIGQWTVIDSGLVGQTQGWLAIR